MTISDERLAEMAMKASLSPHTRDEAAAYRELQSLRAIPRGGVKVKGLEWSEDDVADTPFGTYRVDRTEGGYSLACERKELMHICLNSVDPLQSARLVTLSLAQSDYDRRIFSAIEQEQEPVAWQRVAPDGTIEITRSRSTAAGWDRSENFVRGLYASPSVCEGKVTEEMVERMAVWMAADHAKDEKDYDWAATDNLWKTAWRKKSRAGLTAALSQDKPK